MLGAVYRAGRAGVEGSLAGLQVAEQAPEDLGVIVRVAKGCIAETAEQAPDLAGRVVMIDAWPEVAERAKRDFARGTSAGLTPEHARELLGC